MNARDDVSAAVALDLFLGSAGAYGAVALSGSAVLKKEALALHRVFCSFVAPASYEYIFLFLFLFLGRSLPGILS